jgi:CRISPR/Cas system-associated endoribonuclease Cas2
MERASAQKTKRSKLRDIVLLSMYGASAITLAVLAPNAVRLLKYVEPDTSLKRRADHRIKEAVGRMMKSGHIRLDSRGRFQLTESGQKHAERLRLMSETHPRWDGKWRVVIFDVWERRRRVRNRLRALLVEKGFLRLQDSVWVFPHPCEEFIVLLRAELRLGGALIYIIAESIDREASLKRLFGIPS